MSTSFMEASHPDYRAEQMEAGTTPAAALDAQLVEVAGLIDGHRRCRRPVPSDRAWLREWPGLGSPRTFSRILAGDLEGINVAAKLPDYRGVLAALDAAGPARAAEELYPDLAGAQETELAVLRLMHHHGKDRFILIEGGSGSGKTSALDLVAAGPASGSMVRMEADETWKSLRAAIRRILEALNVPKGDIPLETAALMDKLTETLRRRGRVILTLDEAHHVSGSFLNLAKSILNQTEAMLILAGMATLMQKLRANASQEAQQLFQNRLFCRVRLTGPDTIGTRTWLQRRLGVSGAWKEATMADLAGKARAAGHWSFLRRVAAQLATDGNPDPDDAALLAAATQAASEVA